MAEYFMEKGRDVLIVYDDSPTTPRTYRKSPLLRRTPGVSLSGDIFYAAYRAYWSGLLTFNRPGRGISYCAAIIETQAQNNPQLRPTI